MNTQRYQIIVLGSGFAGSLMATIARRLGLSVALLERGRHPRFVIGESTTPLTNLLLEEIADDYDLPFVRPLSKWGTWQKHTPQLACGIKRGFTYGSTDELGYNAVENIVHVHDLHATILHLLGIDHKRLTVKFQGLDMRLTNVHGNVINELFA